MVLLHTSWKFNGLAGITLLLTLMIVASGFIGRYIYTAIPRTADGTEIEVLELERRSQQLDAELLQWLDGQPELAGLTTFGLSRIPAGVSGARRAWAGWSLAWNKWQIRRRLPAALQAKAAHLQRLQKQQTELHRQIASLVLSRRLLGLWHTVHIPIGAALFMAAFFHSAAALYYATLLK